MKSFLLCIIFCVAGLSTVFAQDSTDTAPAKDTIVNIFTKLKQDSIAHTIPKKKDTVSAIPPKNRQDTTAPAVIKGKNDSLSADTSLQKRNDTTRKAIEDIFTKVDQDVKATDTAGDGKVKEAAKAEMPERKIPDPLMPETSTEVADLSFGSIFKPFKKFIKNTSIESVTNLSILQQDVSYKTKADFTTQYQLNDTLQNLYKFDVAVTKLNTEVETMGVQLKYNSQDKQDSTSTFAKPLFDIVGKDIILQVDTSGKVIAVDTTGTGNKVSNVLSGLSLSGGDFEVGGNFGLMLNKSPDSLQLGDTWTDSVVNEKNRRNTTYKVQNILNDELVIIISGKVSQTGKILSDGVVFDTHFSGTQSGKIHIDRNTRLIKSRSITLNMKGTVDYKDTELPASALSKITETVSEE